MHRHTIYVTYDLPQEREMTRIVPGVKQLDIQGNLVRNEIGEFKTESGKRVIGVRLTLALEEDEDLEREVIEIPAHSQNVQVHVDTLPAKYRSALKSAA